MIHQSPIYRTYHTASEMWLVHEHPVCSFMNREEYWKIINYQQ